MIDLRAHMARSTLQTSNGCYSMQSIYALLTGEDLYIYILVVTHAMHRCAWVELHHGKVICYDFWQLNLKLHTH